MGGSKPASGTGTTVASGIIILLTVICVLLRFFARIRFKAGLGWDDWWILVALLITLLTCGLLVWSKAVDRDSEKVVENLSLDFDYAPHLLFLKISYVCSIMYFSIISSTKVSMPFVLQSLVVLGIVAAFWLATTIATLAGCIPMEVSWHTNLAPEEHCINFNIFWMATGVVEVFIDTLILVLPVRVILGLRLSTKSKLSIIFIFLLGSFVVITGLLRCVYSYVSGARVPASSKGSLWSTIHVGIGIVCSCLPTLRPIFFRSTSPDNSTGYQRYYGGLQGTWLSKRRYSSSKMEGETIPEDLLEEQSLRTDSRGQIIRSAQSKPPQSADTNKNLSNQSSFNDIELGIR